MPCDSERKRGRAPADAVRSHIRAVSRIRTARNVDGEAVRRADDRIDVDFICSTCHYWRNRSVLKSLFTAQVDPVTRRVHRSRASASRLYALRIDWLQRNYHHHYTDDAR